MRRLGISAREAHPAPGQCIDVGCGRAAIAIGTDVIGARGVHGDEHYVRSRPVRSLGQRAGRGQRDGIRADRATPFVSGGQQAQRQPGHLGSLIGEKAQALACSHDRKLVCSQAGQDQHACRERQHPGTPPGPAVQQSVHRQHASRDKEQPQRQVKPRIEPRQHHAIGLLCRSCHHQ